MLNIFRASSCRLFCATTALVLMAAHIGSAAPLNPDDEFLVASKLVNMGFPDYADKLVKQLLLQRPDLKKRAKLTEAEILLHKRKFDEALAIVNAMPANDQRAQAIKLAIANKYYAIGELDKAKGFYNEVFSLYEGRTPDDPDLKRFFQEAAFTFAIMLEKAGDLPGALKNYERVLATMKNPDIKRRLQSEVASLCVRMARDGIGDKEVLLKKAKGLCDKIQWGGMDLWFGQSIITLANIEIARGDRAKARSTIKDYMEILKEIDELIKKQGLSLSVSPMAGARYLMGELYQQDAKATTGDAALKAYSKALGEYYNVFIKYGESDWGPKAGLRAQAVKSILENDFGKTVNIDLGEHAAQAAEAEFKIANNLYMKKMYKKAIAEYLKVLNRYPEGEASVRALANLAQCYARAGDVFGAKMVALYLGERFDHDPNAGSGVLALGKYYYDQKNKDMYFLMYETYRQKFPNDERAPLILYTLAGLYNKNGAPDKELECYRTIVKRYPQSQYYVKALRSLAWGDYANKRFEQAVESFKKYINVENPGLMKAQAQFCMGDSYRQLEDQRHALISFITLIKWLTPENNPYSGSGEELIKNKELLKKATFYTGYCYARMDAPAKNVPAYKANAIKSYDKFVATYPNSDLAPTAMSGKGAVLLSMDKFSEAVSTFDALAAKYPESEEGKSALYSLIKSAMETEKYDVAQGALTKMIANKQSYSADEFVRVGQAMFDAGQFADAARAFEQVLNSKDAEEYLERSLFGAGKSYFEVGDYEQAEARLNELMTKFPKSGQFFAAKFALGTSQLKLEQYDEAMESFSDVMKYADDIVLTTKATYQLGLIQLGQGNDLKALASFQRVALLADPNNKQLRPTIELCLLESVKVGAKTERWSDVVDTCDQYIRDFPKGRAINAIRKTRSQANLKARQAAASAAATQPTVAQ